MKQAASKLLSYLFHMRRNPDVTVTAFNRKKHLLNQINQLIRLMHGVVTIFDQCYLLPVVF